MKNLVFSRLLIVIIMLFNIPNIGCHKDEYRNAEISSTTLTSKERTISDNVYTDVAGIYLTHMTYNRNHFDHHNYLAPYYKNLLTPYFNTPVSSISDIDANVEISNLQSQGILSTNEVASINDFKNFLNSFSDNINYTQAISEIENFQVFLKNNNNRTYDEKYWALLLSETLKNKVEYECDSNGNPIELRGSECVLGLRVKCWGELLVKTLFDVLSAGVKALAIDLISSDPSASFSWAKAKNILYITGGVGLVLRFIDYFLFRQDCKCDNTTPLLNDFNNPCRAPNGFSLTSPVIDCNQSTQWVSVVGQGAGAVLFTYTIYHGTFPDFNNSTTATTSSPNIRVTQTNPNIPIELKVTVQYSNGCFPQTFPANAQGFPATFPTFSMNLTSIVLDPGTVIVSGYNQNFMNDVVTYHFGGTYLSMPNSVIISKAHSSHGTKVSETPTSVTIKWDVFPTGCCYPAWVRGGAQNVCPNNTTSVGILTPIYIQ
jgi:hypothetical protein